MEMWHVSLKTTCEKWPWKPHINGWHQNLFLSSIPGAITVKINALQPACVFINNSCTSLLATSCSAPVCVGMFMDEAFSIELWTLQIFWVNVQGDDSGMHIQLHSIK